ncbi:MAG: hypothetical protein RL173_368 [Fibrobacterota bacterium]|jgi:type VI secretion system protein ImpG
MRFTSVTVIARRFIQEHRSLREEAVDFSIDFPEAARYLNPDLVDDRDPYVERLTESFAFLTARIREAMDSEDGLTQHLLDLLVPDLQQPLPSVTVVEFHPRMFHPSESAIKAGSEVRSVPLGESATTCRYTLNHDIPLRSFGVESAKVAMTDSDETPLELSLESYSELSRGEWSERIPFYLHGDPTVVWAVRFALLRRVARIQVMTDTDWVDCPELRFERLDQPGYASKTTFPGPFSDARDFLCADDRFRFVQLVGAQSALLSVEAPLRLRVEFTGPLPRGIWRAVNADLFRPMAGVVVNRFSEPCQSPIWDHTSASVMVLPQTGSHKEILDVVSVQGLDTVNPSKRTRFLKYSSYRSRTEHAHFQVLRGHKRDGSRSTQVALGGFAPGQELTNQYLAIDAEFSDANLPHDQLSPENLCMHGPGIPEELTFRGLARPSVSFRPPPGSDPRSRLLAFAAGHFEGWLDAARLKDGLRQVLWDTSEAKRSLIEDIQDVSADHDHVLDHGVAWRRMHVKIRLRDTICTPDTWERLGVIDAFGSVLLKIAEDATPIGARTKLSVLVEPAGVALEWAPVPDQRN